MKIYISQTLLNDAGETPKSLTVEMRRQTQTEYALASPFAHVFDRGNARTLISFSIERSHASESEAERFAIAHAAQTDAAAPFALEFSGDGDFPKLRLSDATASKIKTELNDVITLTKYEFTGTKAEEIQ